MNKNTENRKFFLQERFRNFHSRQLQADEVEDEIENHTQDDTATDEVQDKETEANISDLLDMFRHLV